MTKSSGQKAAKRQAKLKAGHIPDPSNPQGELFPPHDWVHPSPQLIRHLLSSIVPQRYQACQQKLAKGPPYSPLRKRTVIHPLLAVAQPPALSFAEQMQLREMEHRHEMERLEAVRSLVIRTPVHSTTSNSSPYLPQRQSSSVPIIPSSGFQTVQSEHTSILGYPTRVVQEITPTKPGSIQQQSLYTPKSTSPFPGPTVEQIDQCSRDLTMEQVDQYINDLGKQKRLLYGRIVTQEMLISIKNEWFSAETFHLLLVVSEIPAGWVIHISDGSSDILRQNHRIKHVGFIVFASQHWFLVHVDLIRKTVVCYDSTHNPSAQPAKIHFQGHRDIVRMLTENHLISTITELRLEDMTYKSPAEIRQRLLYRLVKSARSYSTPFVEARADEIWEVKPVAAQMEGSRKVLETASTIQSPSQSSAEPSKPKSQAWRNVIGIGIDPQEPSQSRMGYEHRGLKAEEDTSCLPSTGACSNLDFQHLQEHRQPYQGNRQVSWPAESDVQSNDIMSIDKIVENPSPKPHHHPASANDDLFHQDPSCKRDIDNDFVMHDDTFLLDHKRKHSGTASPQARHLRQKIDDETALSTAPVTHTPLVSKGTMVAAATTKPLLSPLEGLAAAAIKQQARLDEIECQKHNERPPLSIRHPNIPVKKPHREPPCKDAIMETGKASLAKKKEGARPTPDRNADTQSAQHKALGANERPGDTTKPSDPQTSTVSAGSRSLRTRGKRPNYTPKYTNDEFERLLECGDPYGALNNDSKGPSSEPDKEQDEPPQDAIPSNTTAPSVGPPLRVLLDDDDTESEFEPTQEDTSKKALGDGVSPKSSPSSVGSSPTISLDDDDDNDDDENIGADFEPINERKYENQDGRATAENASPLHIGPWLAESLKSAIPDVGKPARHYIMWSKRERNKLKSLAANIGKEVVLAHECSINFNKFTKTNFPGRTPAAVKLMRNKLCPWTTEEKLEVSKLKTTSIRLAHSYYDAVLQSFPSRSPEELRLKYLGLHWHIYFTDAEKLETAKLFSKCFREGHCKPLSVEIRALLPTRRVFAVTQVWKHIQTQGTYENESWYEKKQLTMSEISSKISNSYVHHEEQAPNDYSNLLDDDVGDTGDFIIEDKTVDAENDEESLFVDGSMDAVVDQGSAADEDRVCGSSQKPDFVPETDQEKGKQAEDYQRCTTRISGIIQKLCYLARKLSPKVSESNENPVTLPWWSYLRKVSLDIALKAVLNILGTDARLLFGRKYFQPTDLLELPDNATQPQGWIVYVDLVDRQQAYAGSSIAKLGGHTRIQHYLDYVRNKKLPCPREGQVIGARIPGAHLRLICTPGHEPHFRVVGSVVRNSIPGHHMKLTEKIVSVLVQSMPDTQIFHTWWTPQAKEWLAEITPKDLPAPRFPGLQGACQLLQGMGLSDSGKNCLQCEAVGKDLEDKIHGHGWCHADPRDPYTGYLCPHCYKDGDRTVEDHQYYMQIKRASKMEKPLACQACNQVANDPPKHALDNLAFMVPRMEWICFSCQKECQGRIVGRPQSRPLPPKPDICPFCFSRDVDNGAIWSSKPPNASYKANPKKLVKLEHDGRFIWCCGSCKLKWATDKRKVLERR
ncbi:MAG: hypothetical protein Q9198_001954 [Flavoplaca austrocitrina]